MNRVRMTALTLALALSLTPAAALAAKHVSEGDVITGELTHYCVCRKCCGKTDGITASGLVIENGVEPEIPVVACNWLPLGSLIEIEDVTYIVADRGGSGLSKTGRVDIFVPDGHQAALELGRRRGIEITVLRVGPEPENPEETLEPLWERMEHGAA